jgi:hypothetical protein
VRLILGLSQKPAIVLADADLDPAIQDNGFIPMDNVAPVHEDVVEEIQQTFAT